MSLKIVLEKGKRVTGLVWAVFRNWITWKEFTNKLMLEFS